MLSQAHSSDCPAKQGVGDEGFEAKKYGANLGPEGHTYANGTFFPSLTPPQCERRMYVCLPPTLPEDAASNRQPEVSRRPPQPPISHRVRYYGWRVGPTEVPPQACIQYLI